MIRGSKLQQKHDTIASYHTFLASTVTLIGVFKATTAGTVFSTARKEVPVNRHRDSMIARFILIQLFYHIVFYKYDLCKIKIIIQYQILKIKCRQQFSNKVYFKSTLLAKLKIKSRIC